MVVGASRASRALCVHTRLCAEKLLGRGGVALAEGAPQMGVALDRIVKHVPSIAVGGVITAATVLAWGKFYQAVALAVCEVSTAVTPGTPCTPGEIPDLSALLGSSRPELPPSPGDSHGPREAVPECASVYPNLKLCSQLPHWYLYGSEREALAELKRELNDSGLRIQTERLATGGPCPGVGKHYNVRGASSSRDYPASIVCCPCCDDSLLGAPAEDRSYGIVYKR